MKIFDELLKIIETLLGPEGCPWDQQQTLKTLKTYLIEETAEVIEAIDLDDNHKIKEELADLFFNALFLCKIAEKEKRFSVEEVLDYLEKKLIRRHPHVFGKAEINNLDELKTQWDKIKQEESGNARKSLMDDVNKELPPLAKAHKMLKKIKKTDFSCNFEMPKQIEDEDSLGNTLFVLVQEAEKKGLDAELALRKALTNIDQSFRDFETFEKPKKI